jgi:hypothetical protein
MPLSVHNFRCDMSSALARSGTRSPKEWQAEKRTSADHTDKPPIVFLISETWPIEARRLVQGGGLIHVGFGNRLSKLLNNRLRDRRP